MAEMSIGDLIEQLRAAVSTLSTVNPYRDLMKTAVVCIRGMAAQNAQLRAMLVDLTPAPPAEDDDTLKVYEVKTAESTDQPIEEPGYGAGV